MIIKFGGYFLLIVFLAPLIEVEKLATTHWIAMTSATAVTVTITSFGFGAIVPSLRVYFAADVKKLKKAILIGSLIPLICYLIWDAAIMGVIPLTGEQGLAAMLHSETSTSDLVTALSQLAASQKVSFFAKVFTSICVLTSFIGVSLAMTDFLSDGLGIEKRGRGNLLVHAATFLPPLGVVLFFPNAFIKALEYAGFYCIVLQIFLPACMAWHGRYHKHFSNHFRVGGGRGLLVALFVFSLAMLVISLTS